MAKSRDAFRTISEVSSALDTPTHVLRFWESKFSQIKPVKRAGGRRYYRPDDILLLSGIKNLLHEQGMTIKGTQKLLREQGVKHVAAMAKDGLFSDDAASVSPPKATAPKSAPAATVAVPPPAAAPSAGTDNVVTFSNATCEQPAEPQAPADPALEVNAPKQLAPRPQILSLLARSDGAVLRNRAGQIAPLVARLESIRDRMRTG